MKKIVAVATCALLGLLAGYFVAPVASVAYVHQTEPDLFGAFYFYLADSSIMCACSTSPPAEALKTVRVDLESLKRCRVQNPNSHLLAQEIGLTEIRVSMLERKIGKNDQADIDLKRGQTELTAIGWKDVSETHLIDITEKLTAIDSRL